MVIVIPKRKEEILPFFCQSFKLYIYTYVIIYIYIFNVYLYIFHVYIYIYFWGDKTLKQQSFKHPGPLLVGESLLDSPTFFSHRVGWPGRRPRNFWKRLVITRRLA